MSQTSSPATGGAGTPSTGADPAPDSVRAAGPVRPVTTARVYGVGARLGDWWAARADGRAGLPSLRPGRPEGTPTIEALAQDFLARCHRERLRVDEQITPLLEASASLTARIPETERAAEAAEAVLAAWPEAPDTSQLSQRRAGERETADDVVVARRSREWEAHRRPLIEQVDTLRERLVSLRGELARLGAAIQAREVAGATRVRRLHAQTMRRISAYERHLVRRHPAGDRIGPVLAAQHPRVPGWVREAEDPEQTIAPTPRPPSHDQQAAGPEVDRDRPDDRPVDHRGQPAPWTPTSPPQRRPEEGS